MLVVTKNVTGTAGDTEKYFSFTVTLDDTSVNGPRGDGTFTSGTVSFTMKHGDVMTFRGLPAGAEYTVTEEDVSQDGYTTTYVNRTGEIQRNEAVTVTVENHKEGAVSPPGGGGGGGGLPPWALATPEADPTPSPTPGASPSPSPSAGPSPTPGGTPGPGQTSQPFGTPQPTRKPGTTSQPFTPGTGGGSGSGSGSGGPTAPATGDETAIAPWAILLALSAAGLAAVTAVGRKRRGRG